MERELSCSQSVLVAFAEQFGLDEDKALSISAGFEGGSFSGEICGAVAGAIMVLGLKYGSLPKEDFAAKISDFKSRFLEEENSLRCKDILGYDFSKEGELEKAVESGRIQEKCPMLIYKAINALTGMI